LFLLMTVGTAWLVAASVGQEPRLASLPRDVATVIGTMGHRNWIVIADSAYPWQAQPGIETRVLGGRHLDLVRRVLGFVATQKHIRPVVYVDKELDFVAEADAAGIDDFRSELKKILDGRPTHALMHEEIIAKLDKAGELFRVLVLKSNSTLPYTSVFIELDCGYWSADAERRLREAMKAKR
jgi:L-fucose mutarotase/ribose pyranase (RbsD/FucU family)